MSEGADQAVREAEPAVEARPQRGPGRRVLRVVVLLVLLGVAVHVLLPQVGSLSASLRALRHVRPGWLVLAAVAVAASFPASAASLVGSAGRRLSLLRVTGVELASACLNRLTPAGLGRLGLLAHYLDQEGMPRAAAVGVVGLNVAAGAVVHVTALVVVLAVFHPSALRPVTLPDRYADLLGVLAVLVVPGAVAGAFWLRRRWDSVATRLAPLRAQLHDVFTRPTYLAAMVGGVLAVNLLMALALLVCLRGFGAHVSFSIVAAVYLGGSAVASVAPTPGGLGAMEAALVVGLTGLGVAAGPAVTGVLGFRLVSWWLPAGVGGLVWARLRHQRVL